jgi:hypothetical protein
MHISVYLYIRKCDLDRFTCLVSYSLRACFGMRGGAAWPKEQDPRSILKPLTRSTGGFTGFWG